MNTVNRSKLKFIAVESFYTLKIAFWRNAVVNENKKEFKSGYSMIDLNLLASMALQQRMVSATLVLSSSRTMNAVMHQKKKLLEK